MLFNSYEFIFAFLPVAAVVFFLLGSRSRGWAMSWLILASLFFYAWWRPWNLLIIVPSIFFNYGAAKALVHLNGAGKPSWSRLLLIFGIVVNVAVLGYFKYANFFVDVTNDIAGTDFVLERIVLPLGISFITFQKIAFLIDVHAGRVDKLAFRECVLFVLFFPQLIAGPIVHFREMMPQFRAAPCTFDRSNVSVGVTLFLLGLSKKVFLADGIAPTVSSIFEFAAAGGDVSLLTAWMAALGFTLQIYFDFSGYTDMALGAARIFGVRLPPNFDSPLRSRSIIEFWSRWHMTLTRFLTAYIYNPLSVWLTRRYLAKGRRLMRPMKVMAFVQLLAFPTVLTMFISGVWHGAGYLFVIWGLVHGFYLVVNHAWREFRVRLGVKAKPAGSIVRFGAFLLTALCVVVSMVIFRAPTTLAAGGIFEGMLGLNGVALPDVIYSKLGPLASVLGSAGITAGLEIDLPFQRAVIWILLMLAIALACPNTLQILREHDPAFGWKDDKSRLKLGSRALWRPSTAWALTIALIAVAAAVRLGGDSEFLYWQF